MLGDVAAPANPDAVTFGHVIEKSANSGGARGMAAQARMQADAHHSRSAFVPKHIESVAQQREEIVGIRAAWAQDVANVVVDERVWDHEMTVAVAGTSP